MYGRPFMGKKGSLKILLDSCSIDKVLPSSSRRSCALLKYHSSKFLQFIRSPGSVENKELQEIVEFQKRYKSDGSLHSIEIVREESKTECAFGYRKEAIEEIGKIIYNKEELNTKERKEIELVFIQATLNWPDGLNILATENDVLLRNRIWFESHFPGGMLSIMTIEEAAEVVDLFLKYHGEYPISDHFYVNKGYWYWLSFRTKVPFYHVVTKAPPLEKSILETFAQKFVFLLMSVDEMGFQYYSGVNNDTMESTIYHFNYFISLLTGIFDSLALQTKNQYQLVFEGSHIPSRTSLHNKTGKAFLRAVRERNPSLRKHINDHVHFIKVIYFLREHVLHREGLREMGFKHSDGWQANFIGIPRELAHCIRQCGDTKEKYEPWTKFGVYQQSFLEPCRFAKTGALLLSEFCNKYLQLLGFTNFIEGLEKNRPEDDFIRTIRVFEKDNLGV